MSDVHSSFWLPAFVREGLVSEPLIWGKLPSRADYVRHNFKHEQSVALQQWIRAQMQPASAPSGPGVSPELPTSAPSRRANASGNKRDAQVAFWHRLAPAPVAPSTEMSPLQSRPSCPATAHPAQCVLPWSFVLPPGTLAFAHKRHVIGVWMDSSDKIGRRYPLVMLQTASPRWIKQYFSKHAAQPCDWLYFAARCLAQAVYAEETEQDRPSYPAADHAAVLVTQLSRLWALYRPGWREALGRGTSVVAPQHAQHIIGAPHPEDVAGTFDGVRFLPWADWPQRLTAEVAGPTSAFWQQDLRGRFVAARHTLPPPY